MRQLGIDYGTCYIKVFDVQDDELKSLDSSAGGASEERLANVITYKSDGTFVVGNPNFITKKTDNEIISNIKSLLIQKEWYRDLECGRRIQAIDVVSDTMKYLYSKFIMDDPNETEYHVTITVPVNFSERQKAIIREAAAGAGFLVESIITEPFAALFYFMKDELVNEHNVLVFDVGGGTTDLCLARINSRDGISVITESTQGINFGGNDIDELIMDYLKVKYNELEESLTKWSQQENFFNKLKLMFEIMELKQKLFYEDFDEDDEKDAFFSPYKGTPIEIVLSAREIEEVLKQHNIEGKIRGILDSVFDAAESLTADKITDVFITGGTSMIPIFRKSIEKYFGEWISDPDRIFRLNDDLDIEEKTFGSVARGAGIYNENRAENDRIECVNKIPTIIYSRNVNNEVTAKYASNCNYKEYFGNIGSLNKVSKEGKKIQVFQSIVVDVDEKADKQEQEVYIGSVPLTEEILALCEGFRYRLDGNQKMIAEFGNNEEGRDGIEFIAIDTVDVQIEI